MTTEIDLFQAKIDEEVEKQVSVKESVMEINYGWPTGQLTEDQRKWSAEREKRISAQDADKSDSTLRLSMIAELHDEFGIELTYLNSLTIGELKKVFQEVE
jgi:hypothetical protein